MYLKLLLRSLLLYILFAFLAAAGLSAPPYVCAEQVRSVHYVEAEGAVSPVMAEYLLRSMHSASEQGAEALVIQLDTPGGLDLSMRKIVKEMLASEIPVIVYVAPAGSRAASAGVFITYAANVAAMAPGTNIGSAHPVAMGGAEMDETMAKKVENDAAAYLMGIATKRGRNAEWAEKAVRESVNITAEEAVKLKVVDLVADSRAELLEKLDGRRVVLPSGERGLETKGAEVFEVEMDLRLRLLDAITNPNVAYILMMVGLLGIYFELSNPGAIFPGVVGAISLVLAFYSFQTLSINYAGLLLIGLAIVFFIVELSVVSYGLLTIAGLVSLVLGSLMLFDTPDQFVKLSFWVVLPTVLFMSALILGTGYFALRIYRKRPVSGIEGFVGEEGTVVEKIGEGSVGKVFVDGEYWNAESAEEIAKDERVRVVEVKGLKLHVEKA
ncbi:MAG: nodulation protein NfeD [Proteobacteria bacterium]|nr:nodulation protein NfeD [Pseudomonadota bacterium]